MSYHQQKPFNRDQHRGKDSSKSTALTLVNVLSDISFCDKQCSNVNDNTVKNNIITHIESKFEIQIIEKSFVVLNPHIIKNVSYHQHIISTISAGNSYLLWFTKIDNIQCCLFIDRKLKNGYFYPKIHCVRYRFVDEIFNDTILTGELIRDNEKRWMFLLSDILVYQGQSVKQQNIISRFEMIYKMLETQYTPDSLIEPCPLQVKKMFMYKDINEIIDDFIPSLTYPCRGLIFYTLNTKNTNYAYLFAREHEIPLKDPSVIEDDLRTKYPHLFGIVSTQQQPQQQLTMAPSDVNTFKTPGNLEDMFKKIYGDDYKKELYGLDYICEYNTPVISSNSYKPIIISSLDDMFNSSETLEVHGVQAGPLDDTNESNDMTILEDGQAVFRILKTNLPDIYNLYWDESGQITKQGVAFVPTMKISKELQTIFTKSSDTLNINVVAEYNVKHQKWQAIKQINNKSPFTKEKVLSIMSDLSKQQ
jgi:hypothetical protein